jgi:hypothetical protein
MLAAFLIACSRDRGDDAMTTKTDSRDGAPPPPPMVVIPAETPLVVALQEPLNSRDNRPGDVFRGDLTVPISVEGEQALPKGSTVLGRVVAIERGGKGSPAVLRLTLTEAVLPSGRRETIQTRPLELAARTSTEKDLEKVAVGGVAGGLVGGIVGGKKGAAVGAVLGAGAGTVVAIATKDNAIRLETGQLLEFHLEEPVRLRPVAA